MLPQLMTSGGEAASADHVGDYGASDWEGRIGHRIGGYRSGPVAIAIGDFKTVEPVFARLMALPSLPFLRGRLYLTYSDKLPKAAAKAIWIREGFSRPDGWIEISAKAVADQRAEDLTYWRVLALCTDLGMISGRGIPLRRISN